MVLENQAQDRALAFQLDPSDPFCLRTVSAKVGSQLSKLSGQFLKYAIFAGLVAALLLLTQDMEPFGRALLVIGLPLSYFVSFSIEDLGKKIGLDRLPPDPLTHDWPEPISPQHEAVVFGQGGLNGLGKGYRSFFGHFAEFSKTFNGSMSHDRSPWRIQDRSKTNLSNDKLGRSYKIFYGGQHVGDLSVFPAHTHFFPDGGKTDNWVYSVEKPDVRFDVEIWNARSLAAAQLRSFFESLFELLAGQDIEETTAARRILTDAMVDAVWRIGPKVVENADLTCHFEGHAHRYISLARAQFERRRNANEDSVVAS